MRFKEFGRDVEVRVQKLKNADMIEVSLPHGPALLDKDQANELIKEIQSKFGEN